MKTKLTKEILLNELSFKFLPGLIQDSYHYIIEDEHFTDEDLKLESYSYKAISLAICNDKGVILVDDVINSGRTLIYAVGKLLDHEVNVLKVAALVNRTHRRYPVHADFVGLDIATTLKDNIMVSLGEEEMAYLE